MRDVRLFELLERQWNRASLSQIEALGYTRLDVSRWVAAERLVAVHEAVFAGRPFLDDQRGRWMAATLTAPETYLSHASSAALHGFWDRHRPRETVTRPGNGGPRRIDGLFVYRSATIAGNVTAVHGIPTTTPERAIIEMAPYLDIGGVARAVREALRTKCTTSADLLRAIDDHARRRGTRRVLSALSRHAGLPVSKAKSAAEIRALMVLRDANRSLPRLNDKVAGEEADLIWDAERLIIEIDGGPFHVYDAPQRLLQLAPTT